MMRHWRSHLFDAGIAALLGLGSALLINALGTEAFPLDDAYIHLSMAQNGLGQGFSFNGEVAESASSSWTWTLLAMVAVLFGDAAESVLLALALGIWIGLLYSIQRVVAFMLPRQTLWPRVWPIAAAVMVACTGNIVWLALGGMESALFAWMIVALVHRFALKRGMDWLAGVLIVLAVLTRLESMAWVLPILLVQILDTRYRASWAGWWIGLAGIALLVIYHLVVVGQVLPSTASGKRATYVPHGFDVSAIVEFIRGTYQNYLARVAAGLGFAIAVVVLLVPRSLILTWRGLLNKRRGRVLWQPSLMAWLILFGGMVGHSLVLLIEFRTSYHHLRYFTPLVMLSVPLIIVGLHVWWAGTRQWIRGRLQTRGAHRVVTTAILIGLGGILALELQRIPVWKTLYTKNADQLVQVHGGVANWLLEHAEEGDKVASFDIGLLRYRTQLELVDMGGLISKEALDFRSRHDMIGYILQERPVWAMSLQNGLDTLPSRHGEFRLEHVRTWQYPEYPDPFHPHTRRIVLYRVNYCGVEQQLVNLPVHTVANFETLDGDWARLPSPWLVEKDRPGLNQERRQGNFFITTFTESQGDDARARWTSPWFDNQGDELTFLLAGGHDPENLRVELIDETDTVIAWWTAWNTGSFLRVNHSLEGVDAKHLALRIIDSAKGHWGHLMLDDITLQNRGSSSAFVCPPERQ